MNWDIISQINNSFITSNLNFLISDDHIEKVKNILTQVDDRAEKLEIPNNNVKPIGVFETANYQKYEEDEESLVIKHSYIFQIDFPYKWEKVIRKMKQNLIDKYDEEYLILISQSLPKTRAKEILTKLINHVIP